MPQFSLKQLLVSVALIAAGCGVLVTLGTYVGNTIESSTNVPYFGAASVLAIYATWIACGALIGAGVFNPFNRPKLGAIIGAGVFCIPLVVCWRFVTLALTDGLRTDERAPKHNGESPQRYDEIPQAANRVDRRLRSDSFRCWDSF